MNPLQNLIQPYIEKLKPIRGFTTDVMPYETFAAPLQSYIQGAAETYKPWYEYFQAKPQKQQLSGAMAAGGANRSGYGKALGQRSLREIYQPLQESLYGQSGILEQYKNQYINPLYKQRIGQYYQSPTTGFNFS